MAAGLTVVHEAGLLHRDIKPANVMLRKVDGSPVLVDFGAARQQMGRQTQAFTAVLTPGYAPMEQYGSKGRQGPWTDLYALGAVAYEALTGRTPDQAPDRAIEDGLPRVERVAPHPVSEELARGVMVALAMDPASRPQTVEEWLDSWAKVVADAPLDPPAPQTMEEWLDMWTKARPRAVAERAARRSEPLASTGPARGSWGWWLDGLGGWRGVLSTLVLALALVVLPLAAFLAVPQILTLLVVLALVLGGLFLLARLGR